MSASKPLLSVMAASGAIPVRAVNDPFPTYGKVPFRFYGDVLPLYAEFDKPWKSGYHVYGGVSLVASFASADLAEEAVAVAEHTLRSNPGPGAHLSHEVGRGEETVMIYQGFIPVGHVVSH